MARGRVTSIIDGRDLKMNTMNPQNFPIDALPPMIRNAVLEVQTNIQAPLTLIVSSALSAISLACQNSADVCRPNEILSPISLAILLIADSGERKSTVDNLFVKPIREFEMDSEQLFQSKVVEHEAQTLPWDIELKVILAAIENAAKKHEATSELKSQLACHLLQKPRLPKAVKLIYSDATPESIKFGLYKNWPSIAIMSAEAANILNGRAMGDVAMINTLWDDGTLHVDRKGSDSFSVSNARLTFAGMIQSKILRKSLNRRGNDLRDIGFLARCFVAYPPSTQGTRFIQNQTPSWQHLPIFQEQVKTILQQNLRDMEAEDFTRIVLKFSPEAKVRWVLAYNNIESLISPGGLCASIKDHATKAAENLARLAALFHFFEGHEGEISFDTVDRAAAIIRWYLLEFNRLFSQTPEIPTELADAYQLDAWFNNLRNQGILTIQKNYIRQYCPNALRSKSRLDAALNCLCIHNRVRFIINGKMKYIELNAYHFHNQAMLQQG
jgi:hypothetical protein